jgi:hypothetical protein
MFFNPIQLVVVQLDMLESAATLFATFSTKGLSNSGAVIEITPSAMTRAINTCRFFMTQLPKRASSYRYGHPLK